MANQGDQGGTNPGQAAHPRMAAGLPQRPGGGQGQQGQQSRQGQRGQQAHQRVGGGGQTTEQSQGQGMASEVASRLGDAWDTTRETVQRGAHAVAERAQGLWSNAGALVRSRPLAAMAIAFSVGCLLGCCMTGRSTDDVADRMSHASA